MQDEERELSTERRDWSQVNSARLVAQSFVAKYEWRAAPRVLDFLTVCRAIEADSVDNVCELASERELGRIGRSGR